MKQSILFTAAFFFLSFIAIAQNGSADTVMKTTIPAARSKEPDEDRIFTKVEEEASYPGGNAAWSEFLQKKLNANIAEKNKAPKGLYQVIARFIVNKAGIISDVECETKHGYGMEEEVIRVIRKSPKWEPAMQNGKPVNAYRRQPITFLVE